MHAHHHFSAGTGGRMFTGKMKTTEMHEQDIYEIRIREILDKKWSTYFSPFLLSTGNEETLLTGVIHDQAELFGVILKIRDLGLHLVSVNPIFPK
jgi:hypothetical protein